MFGGGITIENGGFEAVFFPARLEVVKDQRGVEGGGEFLGLGQWQVGEGVAVGTRRIAFGLAVIHVHAAIEQFFDEAADVIAGLRPVEIHAAEEEQVGRELAGRAAMLRKKVLRVKRRPDEDRHVAAAQDVFFQIAAHGLAGHDQAVEAADAAAKVPVLQPDFHFREAHRVAEQVEDELHPGAQFFDRHEVAEHFGAPVGDDAIEAVGVDELKDGAHVVAITGAVKLAQDAGALAMEGGGRLP